MDTEETKDESSEQPEDIGTKEENTDEAAGE
jgi:hypothetical protein